MFRSALSLGLLLGFLVGSSDAQATVVVPQSLESMTEKASLVVRARVGSTYSGWDTAQRRIYTWVECEVLESLLGGDVPEAVVVRVLGGRVGDVGMNVAGTPRFESGQEVVLFLRASSLEAGAHSVVGMSQGKFDVIEGRVVPSVGGLAYAGPVRGGAAVSTLPSLSLAEFRRKVRQAAGLEASEPEPAPSTPAPPPAVGPPASPALVPVDGL